MRGVFSQTIADIVWPKTCVIGIAKRVNAAKSQFWVGQVESSMKCSGLHVFTISHPSLYLHRCTRRGVHTPPRYPSDSRTKACTPRQEIGLGQGSDCPLGTAPVRRTIARDGLAAAEIGRDCAAHTAGHLERIPISLDRIRRAYRIQSGVGCHSIGRTPTGSDRRACCFRR